MPQERNRDAELALARASERSRHARDELAVAATDLLLPRERRLTERQRAVATDILVKLVDAIEFELRRQLVEAMRRDRFGDAGAVTALSDQGLRFTYAVLDAAGALRDPALLGPVLRRTQEHLIGEAARDELGLLPSAPDLVAALARNPDPELARRAVAYIVALSGRHDAFQEPLLPLDELSEAAAYRLHWRAAAALRRYLVRTYVVEPAKLDLTLENGVRHAMADHAEGRGAALRAARLAARLDELDELDDDGLARLFTQGHVLLFVAGLALRADIDAGAVWSALTDPTRDSLLVLAKGVGLNADATEAVWRTLDRTTGSVRPAAIRSIYDAMDSAAAQRAVRGWRLDPGYREALDEVDG